MSKVRGSWYETTPNWPSNFQRNVLSGINDCVIIVDVYCHSLFRQDNFQKQYQIFSSKVVNNSSKIVYLLTLFYHGELSGLRKTWQWYIWHCL